MIQIIKNICPEDKWHIKCPYHMEPIGITIHNTDNDAPARNEIIYMNRNNDWTSYHFAVDDKEIIQGLPLDRNGWHSSDGNGDGNRRTIAIEICYSLSGGERFDKAEVNAAKLVAYLLKQYGWTTDNIYRHYDWSGKNCPSRTMAKGWQRFIDMVKNNGETKNEWIKNDTGWWYRYKNGSYPANKWEYIDSEWYYFNADGYAVTGWQKIGGLWYYFNEDCKMLTGWHKINGEWYYLDTSKGQAVTGWQVIDANTYYFDENCQMCTGITTIDDNEYLFNKNGYLLKNIKTDDKGRIYN